MGGEGRGRERRMGGERGGRGEGGGGEGGGEGRGEEGREEGRGGGEGRRGGEGREEGTWCLPVQSDRDVHTEPAQHSWTCNCGVLVLTLTTSSCHQDLGMAALLGGLL